MAESPGDFKLLGRVRQVEVIASGRGVRSREEMIAKFGGQRWRKMKGVAFIEDDYGYIGDAEIHWYEAHGVGKV